MIKLKDTKTGKIFGLKDQTHAEHFQDHYERPQDLILHTTPPKQLKTEYKETPCLYCGQQKLKEKTKWKQGEKIARGHDPEHFNYYQCMNPKCGKVSMSNKEEKIQ